MTTTETCETCGRPHSVHAPADKRWQTVTELTIQHESKGCDTGCCGHQMYAFDADGRVVDSSGFSSVHYDSMSEAELDTQEWAHEHGRDDVPFNSEDSYISSD